jgi:hypothetical protein
MRSRITYCEGMAYATAEARRDLLDAIAAATDRIGVALAALGAAYEQLDEQSGDRLEQELFRPVQLAYGRARRAHSGFAERHGLPGREFEPSAAGHPSQGVKGFVDAAAEALAEADQTIANLQDSMLPVEVGDPQLRAELAEVRELIGPLPARTQRFVSLFGR